jgi:hypothetical protein
MCCTCSLERCVVHAALKGVLLHAALKGLGFSPAELRSEDMFFVSSSSPKASLKTQNKANMMLPAGLKSRPFKEWPIHNDLEIALLLVLKMAIPLVLKIALLHILKMALLFHFGVCLATWRQPGASGLRHRLIPYCRLLNRTPQPSTRWRPYSNLPRWTGRRTVPARSSPASTA